MHIIKKIAYILVIIGGLNWGVIGVTGGVNLVSLVSNEMSVIENIIYVLVGLSAVLLVFARRSGCSCPNQECECEVQVADIKTAQSDQGMRM